MPSWPLQPPTAATPGGSRPARLARVRPRRAGSRAAALASAALALAATACSSGTAAGGAGTAGRPGTLHGVASVAFAGSLEELATVKIGPGFERATGDGFEGRGGGSFGLASEILSGEIDPGVFLSIGRAPIERLEPRRARVAIELGSDPLVLAYSPRSRFAPRLAEIARGQLPLADLFSLLGQPGFRLGRTDPTVDPQGRAFVMMVELAVEQLHLPPSTVTRVLGITAANPVGNRSQIFDETGLDATLEAGELDAASAFRSQALEYHLPFVPLPPSLDFGDPSDAAVYASSTLRLASGEIVHGTLLTLDATLVSPPPGAPPRPAGDAAADAAFLAYLLSPAGRGELEGAGYELFRPVVYGDAAVLPPVVARELRADGARSR